MDSAYLEELYISVRPYLSDAESIRTFLDGHESSTAEELMLAIEDAVDTYQGTKKTDFTILLNAHRKLMGQKQEGY